MIWDPRESGTDVYIWKNRIEDEAGLLLLLP